MFGNYPDESFKVGDKVVDSHIGRGIITQVAPIRANVFGFKQGSVYTVSFINENGNFTGEVRQYTSYQAHMTNALNLVESN